MAALSGFANFVALEGLVTPGDPAATAQDVAASETLFRLAVGSLLLVVALDVVIAWALFRVFRPVHAGLSMLAAWFRLAYAAVFMVAISELLGALRLLGDGYLAVFDADQLHAEALLRIEAFTDTWDAGLILFGLSLLIIGYLAYRSGYVPKILGVLLGIAGFGYLFDSLLAIVTPGASIKISVITFVGEFLLAIWLVIWGRRVTVHESALDQDPVGVSR